MKKKIFLIEDDPFICDIVQTKFRNTDFEIEFAHTAKESLEHIGKELPDLVLLDLGLPDTPGIEVLKILKSEEEYKRLPIIIFTNNDSVDLRQEAEDLGADGFFGKDEINPEKLIEQVGDVIWK